MKLYLERTSGGRGKQTKMFICPKHFFFSGDSIFYLLTLFVRKGVGRNRRTFWWWIKRRVLVVSEIVIFMVHWISLQESSPGFFFQQFFVGFISFLEQPVFYCFFNFFLFYCSPQNKKFCLYIISWEESSLVNSVALIPSRPKVGREFSVRS